MDKHKWADNGATCSPIKSIATFGQGILNIALAQLVSLFANKANRIIDLMIEPILFAPFLKPLEVL